MQVALTTKLTTEQLDDVLPKTAGFRGNLDNLGRVWTARRVLHTRRVPVRFLSHLPSQSLNSWG